MRTGPYSSTVPSTRSGAFHRGPATGQLTTSTHGREPTRQRLRLQRPPETHHVMEQRDGQQGVECHSENFARPGAASQRKLRRGDRHEGRQRQRAGCDAKIAEPGQQRPEPPARRPGWRADSRERGQGGAEQQQQVELVWNPAERVAPSRTASLEQPCRRSPSGSARGCRAGGEHDDAGSRARRCGARRRRSLQQRVPAPLSVSRPSATAG